MTRSRLVNAVGVKQGYLRGAVPCDEHCATAPLKEIKNLARVPGNLPDGRHAVRSTGGELVGALFVQWDKGPGRFARPDDQNRLLRGNDLIKDRQGLA